MRLGQLLKTTYSGNQIGFNLTNHMNVLFLGIMRGLLRINVDPLNSFPHL